MRMTIRTYSELILLPTFEERFKYLNLDGLIGEDTFGFDRYLNQYFYKNSLEWKKVRRDVIIRDNGCDLGSWDRPIFGKILIHHMNPLTKEDILKRTEILLNPEYLISTSLDTHNAIHYGSIETIIRDPIERTKNDTCPWKNF